MSRGIKRKRIKNRNSQTMDYKIVLKLQELHECSRVEAWKIFRGKELARQMARIPLPQ